MRFLQRKENLYLLLVLTIGLAQFHDLCQRRPKLHMKKQRTPPNTVTQRKGQAMLITSGTMTWLRWLRVVQKHLLRRREQRRDQKTLLFVELVSHSLSTQIKLIKEKLLETMIELVGSKVVTRRPTDSDINMETEEDADDKEATPYARTLKTTEDVETEPEFYQTPVALTPANWRKKAKTRKLVPVEVESSDIEFEEIQPLREEKKKQRVTQSATDGDNLKVTSH
jgi:hypothetical protein